MLSDKIKKYRKAQKLGQKDLAVQLHVVRQTVSKWKNALSVPDADLLPEGTGELELYDPQ